jgi:hypothetical protein
VCLQKEAIDVLVLVAPKGRGQRTIWGKSRESFPMVLKTRSCNRLTMLSSSSPSEAIAPVVLCGVLKGRGLSSITD